MKAMSDDRLAQLVKMLDATPDDAFCLYGLAHEYAKRGEFDDAIAHFDRTIEVDPDQCYAYYHKARTLDDADRSDEARAVARAGLDRALSVGDEHAAAELQALLDDLG
jgi:Flp pilus assembly protein TadD